MASLVINMLERHSTISAWAHTCQRAAQTVGKLFAACSPISHKDNSESLAQPMGDWLRPHRSAIFTEDQKDSSTELAFKYAVYRINKDKHLLAKTTLVYDIQYVPKDDSFHASKKGPFYEHLVAPHLFPSAQLHYSGCRPDVVTAARLGGAVVAWWLDHLPHAKAKRVRFLVGLLPDFFKLESCRTKSLVGGFSPGFPVIPLLHYGTAAYSPRLTLIGSHDLDVKSNSKLFTPLTLGAETEQVMTRNVTRSEERILLLKGLRCSRRGFIPYWRR
ncbi:hypothetical protein PR048_030965 [Dryococelus australis]|uniref:Uncharacterized protein n=1 Tax=Dryococelus australis TaxID=614101 RepID=A0ABQ9GAD2_9NEOP|nr:hypothetical protein PR048_030965 [Dryococelus australis]